MFSKNSLPKTKYNKEVYQFRERKINSFFEGLGCIVSIILIGAAFYLLHLVTKHNGTNTEKIPDVFVALLMFGTFAVYGSVTWLVKTILLNTKIRSRKRWNSWYLSWLENRVYQYDIILPRQFTDFEAFLSKFVFQARTSRAVNSTVITYLENGNGLLLQAYKNELNERHEALYNKVEDLTESNLSQEVIEDVEKDIEYLDYFTSRKPCFLDLKEATGMDYYSYEEESKKRSISSS